MIILHQGC